MTLLISWLVLSKNLKIDGFRWSLLGSLTISIIAALIDWALRTALA